MSEKEEMLKLEEVQKLALEVLKATHTYCEKYHLRYCLMYGTLIGVIRHQGFIPWDDDVDILMPRDDYEKLKELVKKDPIAPYVNFVDYLTCPSYHYVPARVCHSETQVKPTYLIEPVEEMGVWVDIFPLDGYHPILFWIQKPVQWILNMLNNINNYLVPPTAPRWKRAIQKFVRKCFPNTNNKYAKRMERVSQWAKYSECEKVTVVSELEMPEKVAFPRKDLENAELGRFEDAEFYIPRNADKILRRIYGDYMQLPPEEKRIPRESMAQRRRN